MVSVNWNEEATAISAQCWCDEETSSIEMDVRLANAFAKRIAMWMETAAQNQRNTDYYRDLLIECGEIIGEAAFISDDGSVQTDVLCAKIPDLVKEKDRIIAQLRASIEELTG